MFKEFHRSYLSDLFITEFLQGDLFNERSCVQFLSNVNFFGPATTGINLRA